MQGPASITVTGIAAPVGPKIWVMPTLRPSIPLNISLLPRRARRGAGGLLPRGGGSRSSVPPRRGRIHICPLLIYRAVDTRRQCAFQASSPSCRRRTPTLANSSRGTIFKYYASFANLKLDLDVHARRQIQPGQRLHRLGSWIHDVDQPLVRADLELLP